ncbi:unnamed protein product, partial [Prorocentrum cordatum]
SRLGSGCAGPTAPGSRCCQLLRTGPAAAMRLRRAGAGRVLLALALLGSSAPVPLCSLAPLPLAAPAARRGAACARWRRRPTAARCAAPGAAPEPAGAAAAAPEQGFYEVLGVAVDADAATLKAAYRQAARAAHPDLADPGERERMQERFEAVNRAFEVLSDPEKRLAYDLRGLAGLAEFEFDGERSTTPGQRLGGVKGTLGTTFGSARTTSWG